MMFADLPQERFDVILADPPWSYYGSQTKWAAAAKFYQTLSTDVLSELPVGAISAAPSVLFMWTTSTKIPDAITLMERWGFFYRGVAFVWVKTKKDGTPIGAQGVRPSITKPLTEFVLAGATVATSRPLKLSDESVRQTVFSPKQEHSRKPTAVAERIELMYPTASKIELFARGVPRLGWTAWGDQVETEETCKMTLPS